MEKVPDMDALLDELEEAVAGSRRKHSKISETGAEQAVVIELPVHLRKLSEKETIRIELKPPDPPLASLDEFSGAEAVPPVALGTVSTSNGKGEPPTSSAAVEVSMQLESKSAAVDEGDLSCGESERDTEFEEVLKYLGQFDEKEAAVAVATAADSTIDNEAIMDSGIASENTQADDGSMGSSFEHDEQTQISDGEALRRVAEAVADAVLDAISESVEVDLDDYTIKKQDRRSSGSVADSTEFSSIYDNENTVGEAAAEILCAAAAAESVLTVSSEDPVDERSTSCTTESASMVTVIHRPEILIPTKTIEEALTEDVTQTDDVCDRMEKVPTDGSAQADQMECIQPLADSPLPNHVEESEPQEYATVSVAAQPPARDSENESTSAADCGPEEPRERDETVPLELVTESVDVVKEPVRECVQKTAVQSQSDHSSTSASVYSLPSDDDDLQPRCERAGSEESAHGLETAIECESREDDLPSPVAPRDRFGAQVISTIHDLSQDSDPTRLTESELQLGKSKPYWIPDDDCSMCMLCNAKFSLLNRRHHCRACGRVACGACCKEKATLQYLKDDPKKQAQARVCGPCASMLARIEEHEKMMREHAEGGGADETTASTSTGSRVARGVLKTRTHSVGESEETAQPSETNDKKRSVVFRDGVKPGASSPSGASDSNAEEKSTVLKPKKKSRKRHAVARRVAELRMEDELACALPTASRPQLLVVCPTGEMKLVDDEWVSSRLREDLPVTVVLKKNLSSVVKICNVSSMSVFCVHSCGFATIGLDEVLFVWKREKLDDFSVPLNVLHRIAQVYSTSCEIDQAGVRQVCQRLPALHSVPIALPPLSRHILFFPPTLQDFSSLVVPNSPFLVALFLNDSEVPWAMACPNRLLFRLGLKYSWYPTTVVNIVGREAVYSTETSQTVLKVFTDFRSWSFRMKHLAGCTVTLNNDVTLVEIPKCAKDDLKEIVSMNRKMLAWTTSVNLSADSHLVCDEADGVYSTQVLARGASRKATGASFIIIDGGLKTNGLQISVVEDGVAIRIPSEKLDSLLQALDAAENWVTTDSSGTQFAVRWIEGNVQQSAYGARSAIDGMNLAEKYQYGLSLERAISSVFQVNSIPDYGVRLSHVYNLKDGRLAPEDEPKVFSVAEMLARECTGMLEPYLTMLINMNIMSISIRVGVSSETVEYDVSQWFGMEEEQMLYKQNMDQLIPVLYDILGYLSGGFHIELTLSFVSTKSLPYSI